MKAVYRKQWKIQAASGAPLAAILDDPETLPAFQPIESSRNTFVFRFEHNGQAYYSKTYTHLSAGRMLKDALRGIWSERVVRIQNKMRKHGFAVPEIVCYGRRKMRGTIIYREVAGKSLVEWQRELANDRLEQVFAALGHCVGRLHREGFFHGDLHLGNIFCEKPDRPVFVFIDNDRSKHRPLLPCLPRRKNLARLLYSLEYYRSDAERFWHPFYKAYCSENSAYKSKFRRWEKSILKKARQMAAGRDS